MPKERIPATTQPKYQDVEPAFTVNGTATTSGTTTTSIWPTQRVTTYPFEVQVSWGNKHPSVTIATVNTEEEPYTPLSGWHVELTRAEVNRLITTLRRARDKAFGKDA